MRQLRKLTIGCHITTGVTLITTDEPAMAMTGVSIHGEPNLPRGWSDDNLITIGGIPTTTDEQVTA